MWNDLDPEILVELAKALGVYKATPLMVKLLATGVERILGPGYVRRLNEIAADKIRMDAQAGVDARLIAARGKIDEENILADLKAHKALNRTNQKLLQRDLDSHLSRLPPSDNPEVGLFIRSVSRVADQLRREQDNLEGTFEKAATFASESEEKPSENPVGEDFLNEWIDNAKRIGDEEMQKIWGRILADEVARPGRFSKSTINIVRVLGRPDAVRFTKLCTYVWTHNGSPIAITQKPFPDGSSLSFLGIKRLEELGLIRLEPLGVILRGVGQLTLDYFGRKFFGIGNPVDIPIGSVLLTTAGRELHRICKGTATPDYNYEKSVCDTIGKLIPINALDGDWSSPASSDVKPTAESENE